MENFDNYEIIRGSDVVRDGMFLELSIKNSSPMQQLAEIFYSDITHDFVLTCFREDIPLHLIEELIKGAHRLLPPMTPDTPC